MDEEKLTESVNEIWQRSQKEVQELSTEQKENLIIGSLTIDYIGDKLLLSQPVLQECDFRKAIDTLEGIVKLILDGSALITPLGMEARGKGSLEEKVHQEAHNEICLMTLQEVREAESEGGYVYGLPLLPEGNGFAKGSLILTSSRALEESEKQMLKILSKYIDSPLSRAQERSIIPTTKAQEEEQNPTGEITLFGIGINKKEYLQFKKEYVSLCKTTKKLLITDESTYIPLPVRGKGYRLQDITDQPYKKITERISHLITIAKMLPKTIENGDFTDLVKEARKKLDGEAATIASYMNEKTERQESLRTISQEHRPHFHVANLGEAIAHLTIYQVLRNNRRSFTKSDEAEELRRRMAEYPIANAYFKATKEIPINNEAGAAEVFKEVYAVSFYRVQR